jgi:hypothetical protein
LSDPNVGRRIAFAGLAVMACAISGCNPAFGASPRSAPSPAGVFVSLRTSPPPAIAQASGPSDEGSSASNAIDDRKGLPPARLMSHTTLDYQLSNGLHVTLPGEFVYPPDVAAAVAPPFPLQGHLEYLDSPDTTDSGPAGAAIAPVGPHCTGRCLMIESVANTTAQEYARRRLRTSITNVDHGTIQGDLITVSSAAFGWRFTLSSTETVEQLATTRGGTTYVFSLLAPTSEFASEAGMLPGLVGSVR